MARTQQTFPLEFTETPSLDVQVVAERITVMPVEPNGTPRIELQTRRPEEHPLEIRRDGDRVVVSAANDTSVWRWTGVGSINRMTIFVPQHVRARIRQDFGQLIVENLAGCDLDLAASAGTIDLHHVRGRLKAAVDSGTISGEHLGGTFDLVSQAGSVKLSIDALDAGEHRVRTSMGSVKLWLAPSVKVKMNATTTLGSTRVTHPSTADAEAVLQLNAELGSIRVKTGDETVDPRHRDWPDWRRLWRDLAQQAANVVMEEIPRPDAKRRVPDEELRKVLELVETGKLNASDAERLIRAMGR